MLRKADELNMKKLFATMLILCLMIPTVHASMEVGYSDTTQNVYIEGITKEPNAYVTLTVQGRNDKKIAYVNQYLSNELGKYKAKFKFDDNVDNYIFRVKEGTEDIVDDITLAKAEVTSSFSVALKNTNYGAQINTDDIVRAVVRIKNKYGDNGTYKILTAFYDERDRLTGVAMIDGEYMFDDINTTHDYSSIAAPANSKYAKAYLFNNMRDIMPLSVSYRRDIEDKSFGGDNTSIKVVFIGDSITHNGWHLSHIEHYYETRYPKRKIEIINKGIGGDNTSGVYERLDYDILDEQYTGEADECVLMIGTNDASNVYDPNNADSVKRVENTLEKYEKIIQKIIAEKKGLTLMTSCVVDATEFTGAVSEPDRTQKNAEIGEIAKRVKELAQKYNLPCIDEWTSTNEFTNARRSLGDKNPVITGTDRVHPEDNGGFYMAYQFIKQQGAASTVAEVEINAADGNINAQNASVSVKERNANALSYTYNPYALPMAYSDAYKNAEKNWNLNISDEINREIIKITNLDSGTYTVSMDSAVIGTYTAEELTNGINIAVNANNPGQIQSKEAYSLVDKKIRAESMYRAIALTEQQMKIYKLYTYKELKEKVSGLDFFLNLYFNEDSSGYRGFGYKPNQEKSWAEIKEMERQARELSIPNTHNVTVVRTAA